MTEAQKEANKRWRKKNKDKLAVYARDWRKKNPEKHKGYLKNWNEKNPGKQGEYIKKWIEKNPEKYKSIIRNNVLKSKYGITNGEYNDISVLQNGTCKICLKNGKRKLAVDHDHETGKIRGLLCVNCNMGLGYFKDDISLLKAAIRYLEK